MSPLKMSKKSKAYFDMDFYDVDGGTKRAVCFQQKRYTLFQSLNDSQTQGVVIKRPRMQDDNILITDYSQIKKKTLKSPESESLKVTSVEGAFSECALFERVHLQGIVTHLSEIKERERDGKLVKIRTAIILDNSGFGEISFFGDHVYNVAEKEQYALNHIVVSRYKLKRVLKTTDVTKIVKIDNLDIDISSHDVQATIKKITGKFVAIDTSMMAIRYYCPNCHTSVEPSESLLICSNCTTVSAVDQCFNNAKLPCTFIDSSTKNKLQVTIAHGKLERVVSVPIQQNLPFLKQLFSSSYSVLIDFDENEIQELEVLSSEEEPTK